MTDCFGRPLGRRVDVNWDICSLLFAFLLANQLPVLFSSPSTWIHSCNLTYPHQRIVSQCFHWHRGSDRPKLKPQMQSDTVPDLDRVCWKVWEKNGLAWSRKGKVAIFLWAYRTILAATRLKIHSLSSRLTNLISNTINMPTLYPLGAVSPTQTLIFYIAH